MRTPRASKPGKSQRASPVAYGPSDRTALTFVDSVPLLHPAVVAVAGDQLLLPCWRHLFELLDEQPDLYLDEIAQFLLIEYDCRVSLPAISRTLRSNGWSKKMPRRRAGEQSQDLRNVYQYKLSFLNPKNLIFVDESGCDKRVGFRRTAWSRRGVTPVQVTRFHRGQRYHILPAYTVDGILLARVY
jgi:Winged helix-turn helix